MTFVNDIAHTRFLNMDWQDKLKGIKIYFLIWGVKNATNEEQGGWTFPTFKMWDDYYYSQNKVDIAFTNTFVLGSDTVQVRDFNIKPNQLIQVERKVNSTFVGIPSGYSDIKDAFITFTKILGLDEFGQIPMEGKFRDSRFMLLINFDFNQRKTVQNYYGFSDLLAKVGGYRASLQPIFQLFTPIFIIGFLIQLSTIISDNYKKKYNDELALGIEKYSNHLDMYALPENVKRCKTKIQKKEATESDELQEAFDFIADKIQKKYKKEDEPHDGPHTQTVKPDAEDVDMSYSKVEDKKQLPTEAFMAKPDSLENTMN